MNILYIHQYFATPLGKTGTRSYEFARRWVQQGHTVRMLTTTAYLSGEDIAKARGRFVRRFTIDGIKVSAISIPYRQNMGIIKRCAAFAAFMVVASFFAIFCKYDITYATSTPLTVGIPALCAKWIGRKKFVFEVRDQWPEIPIELGIIKNGLLQKFLLRLERTIYCNAASVVALSPGMAAGIKMVLGTSAKVPVTVISNGCDTNVFRPDIDGSVVRARHNWQDKFVLLHAGAMGKVNSLMFLVDVAEKLQQYQDILFVLIGHGGQRQMLVDRIAELGLKNIELLNAVPKKEMPAYMAACDISTVIIGNYPIIEHNSANKFFDSLGAGKPVLLNYSGWQRQLLETNNAGFGTQLCDTYEFVQKVVFLYNNRQLVTEMGNNGRRIVLTQFDHALLSQQAISVVKNAFFTE